MAKMFSVYRKCINITAALLLAAIIIVPTFVIAAPAKNISGHEQHLCFNGVKCGMQISFPTNTPSKVSAFHFKKCHKAIVPSQLNLAKVTAVIINELEATTVNNTLHTFEKMSHIFSYRYILRLRTLLI
jgi:hypothetical protein